MNHRTALGRWQGPPLQSVGQTWDEQQDLGALTTDRPLLTSELFEGNGYYGFDLILKRYADVAADYPLKALVPHGITLDPGFVWKEERNAPLPGVLCYEPHRRRLYATACPKKVLAAASPYLYLLEMLPPPAGQDREGTLFFPSHSTHHIAAATSGFEAAAGALENLPSEAGPVRVCMYWRDLALGHDAPFRQRGFPIVSAGHIYDLAFPLRLHHLLQRHRYAAGNDLGSHMAHALASGCGYFHVGPPMHGRTDQLLRPASRVGEVPWIRPDLSVVRPLYDRLVDVFGAPYPGDRAAQQELSSYLLGRPALQSPDVLRSTLEGLERDDRWGYRPTNGTRWFYRSPPRAARAAARVRSRLALRRRLTSLRH